MVCKPKTGALVPLPQRPPAEQRAFLIYYARVMLREVRARRGSKGNEWMLLGAARARREAAAIRLETQCELFGGD